jgi:small-conductance mechanosensitive channel
LFLLDSVWLRQPVFDNVREIWVSRLSAGAVTFRVGDVVLFGATVWAAFAFSRMLRFILAEEVYPRANLAPGLHYSVSTVLHYVILLGGFLIALGLLGFDLTRLTILAGAFSVGLGFGLQNVVNNFVSGIILLFERPIKIGDVIQLSSAEGIVQRIGIRASVIRTAAGSEIIVPNGKLISDEVTNWTLSDRQRRISIPVTLLAGADPKEPMELLKGVAAAHPKVLKTPAPEVLLTHFGGGSLGLELRAWTELSEDWSRINSELSLAVREALLARNLSPQ